jgi:hypothetical protein
MNERLGEVRLDKGRLGNVWTGYSRVRLLENSE